VPIRVVSAKTAHVKGRGLMQFAPPAARDKEQETLGKTQMATIGKSRDLRGGMAVIIMAQENVMSGAQHSQSG
jgi:hypothetical protein